MKPIFQKYKPKENISKPIVTREHGSWAILLIPVITALSAAHHFSLQELLSSFFCIFFSFMSYVPAETLINKRLKKYPADSRYYSAVFWLSIYFSISCFSGAYIISILNRPLLIVFGLLALLLFTASKLIHIKTKAGILSDLFGVAGLTLSAPVMLYILDGKINIDIISIWLFNFLFFGSSTIYVHMKLRASAIKGKDMSSIDKVRLGWINLVYHFIITILLIIYSIKFPSQGIIVLAFIPMIIHAVIGTFRYDRKTNFKNLGYTLLTYSVVFALFFFLSIK